MLLGQSSKLRCFAASELPSSQAGAAGSGRTAPMLGAAAAKMLRRRSRLSEFPVPMNRKVGRVSCLPRERARANVMNVPWLGPPPSQAGSLPYLEHAPVQGPNVRSKTEEDSARGKGPG